MNTRWYDDEYPHEWAVHPAPGGTDMDSPPDDDAGAYVLAYAACALSAAIVTAALMTVALWAGWIG